MRIGAKIQQNFCSKLRMNRHLFIAPVFALLICSLVNAEEIREFSIFFTNDIESVYEPISAYWDDEIAEIGGISFLTSLIKQRRGDAETSFLFDAGDLFTGSLSKATQGRLVFDIYSAMNYDAVNIGNHEFEYGWRVLRQVMQRARFPFLSANLFYEGTNINFARQYTILEKNDIRVGVIGVIGIDAFNNATMKANRQGLEVRAPAPIVQELADQLASEVDMIVVLTHQNQTAPMQSNKAADKDVQRGYQEDYDLAGEVTGIHLIIGGHSDHGLWELVRHPKTGTWIGQTFGQGQYLGEAVFRLSATGDLGLVRSQLLAVDSAKLQEDASVSQLIEDARARHPNLNRVVGQLSAPAFRQYNQESNIGNLLADVIREYGEADLGMIGPGSIRTDLGQGGVTVEKLNNVFPFTDRIVVVEVTGETLRGTLEYSLSLKYGLAQFSGLQLSYDPNAPVGQRLRDLTIGGQPVDSAAVYSLATTTYNATGGDGYAMLASSQQLPLEISVAEAIVQFFEKNKKVAVPALGRQVKVEP